MYKWMDILILGVMLENFYTGEHEYTLEGHRPRSLGWPPGRPASVACISAFLPPLVI